MILGQTVLEIFEAGARRSSHKAERIWAKNAQPNYIFHPIVGQPLVDLQKLNSSYLLIS